MADYSITFEILPKPLWKLKLIKKNKAYTLPEAEYLYDQMMKQANEKKIDLNILGNILCVVRIKQLDSPEKASEFDLPAYDPSNPRLSDKISFDLSKARSLLGTSEEDQKTLKDLDEIEEGMMEEFLKPYDPEISEKEASHSFLLKKGQHSKSRHRFSWPFTKERYQQEDDDTTESNDIQRQLEEEAQYEASLSSHQTETSSNEVVQSESKHKESMNDDLSSVKPIVKGEATKRFIENTPTSQRKESPKPSIGQEEKPLSKIQPLDKATFIKTQSDDIQQTIQQVLDLIQVPKEEGVRYLLDHLVYEPDDVDFIKKEKQDYLKEVYSTQDLEKHYLELKSYIQQLQNESNQALNDYYNQVMKRDDSQALTNEHQRSKEKTQSEYQQRFDHLMQQLDHEYQLAKEAMEARHDQEKKDLAQRHEKEQQQLTENHQHKKQTSQQDLEQALTTQFKTEWKQKEAEGKASIQTQKNADLMIGKDNILSQLKANIQDKEIEERQYMKQWIARWNKGIQAKQSHFQNAYTLYKEQLQQQAEEKRRQEAEAKEERRMKLEEEKLAVEKQQSSAQQIQNEAEIKQLKQTIDNLTKQLEDERLDNANLQNQFLQTIQDQRYHMSQWMKQPSSTEPTTSDSIPLSKVKKWVVGGIAGLLLATGAVGFGVKSYDQHVANVKAQQEAQREQTKKQKELEEALKATKSTLDDVKKENQSLNKENQKQAQQLADQQKEKDDSK